MASPSSPPSPTPTLSVPLTPTADDVFTAAKSKDERELDSPASFLDENKDLSSSTIAAALSKGDGEEETQTVKFSERSGDAELEFPEGGLRGWLVVAGAR